MTRIFRPFLTLAAFMAGTIAVSAQQASVFDPLESFKQVSYPKGDRVRNAAGKPGPEYWQNRADYKITASFDTLSRVLRGTEELTYFNNSPDVLQEVWLLLGQNRFRKDSRTTALTPLDGSRFGIQEFTEGFVLEKISIKNKKTGLWTKAEFKVMNDQLKVLLPEGLKSKEVLGLSIAYHFTLPKNGSDFMGVLPTRNGSIYQLSAWFPRIAVYDDIEGWNTANAGYYIEPGKMDYKITLPSECIVQGTGQLMNPEQVLTKVQLERFRTAAKSNQTVQIRTAKEVGELSSRPATGPMTWHFSTDNAGDALFAVSKAFIWDAVKVNLPDNRTAMAMSLYPVESNFETWQQSAQIMKKVLESYSGLWYPYPYTSCVNIAGPVTGIGGPGASFIHYQSNGMANGVWPKVNHELGHSWFNMMVAGNGRHSWMVEGLNSFINHVNGEVLHGETAFQMADAVDWLGKVKPSQAVSTPYELLLYKNFALMAYMKPAVALNLLRNQVLGRERFDAAFRTFIQSWKFKHPMPSDFFRCMEKESGESLSWFWQSWFLNDWTLDQSILSVQYVDGQPEKGVKIKLANKGKMVMPAVLEIIEFNGQVNRVSLPAEIWQKDTEWSFYYPSTSNVISVKLDPDHQLPDRNLSDNVWRGNDQQKKVPEGLSSQVVLDRYFAAIGGENLVQNLKQAVLKYTKGEGKSLYTMERSALFPDQYNLEFSFASIPHPLQKYTVNADKVNYQKFGAAGELNAGQNLQVKQICRMFPEMEMLNGNHQLRLADSTRNINGTDAYVLFLDEHSAAARAYYYDVKTGFKVKEEDLQHTDDDLPYTTIEMAEYKGLNGLMLPYTLIFRRAGENEYLLKGKDFKLSTN
jgi:hypothetical protein